MALVAGDFGGRLGNNLLQAYRAVWFARVHGLDDSSVVLNGACPLFGLKLGEGVRKYAIPSTQYAALEFNRRISTNVGSVPELRRQLTSMVVSPDDSIMLCGATFIYPELPWEKALFARLFDNREMRMRILDRYGHVLCGTTVGYTIRRTDTLKYHWYRTLSDDDIYGDIRRIVEKHEGLVRVLLASDDDAYVSSFIERHEDLVPYVYHIREREDETLYLLSMCDYVFSNGDGECSSEFVGSEKIRHTSTFGQVAIALGRSYKYAGLDIAPASEMGVVDSSGIRSGTACGCSFTYPEDRPISR